MKNLNNLCKARWTNSIDIPLLVTKMMTEKDVKLKAIFKLEAKSCSKEKNNGSNIEKDNINTNCASDNAPSKQKISKSDINTFPLLILNSSII